MFVNSLPMKSMEKLVGLLRNYLMLNAKVDQISFLSSFVSALNVCLLLEEVSSLKMCACFVLSNQG